MDENENNFSDFNLDSHGLEILDRRMSIASKYYSANSADDIEFWQLLKNVFVELDILGPKIKQKASKFKKINKIGISNFFPHSFHNLCFLNKKKKFENPFFWGEEQVIQ